MNKNFQKYFTLLTISLMTCQSAEQTQEADDAVAAGTNRIHLQRDQLEQVNITVVNIQRRLVGDKIRVNGMFDVPPQNRAEISSFVEASVRKTSLLVGDKVMKGQVLAWLEHPDLITLQNDLLEKHQQLEYLRSEYERQAELDKNRINAKKNLIKAETSFRGMQAHVNALGKKVKMLGMDPERIVGGNIYDQIALRSPLNGYITAVHASLGTMVKPGEPIFEIIDPDHIHIEMKLFEKDIHRISVNEPFTFRMTGDSVLHTGTIYLIGKQLNDDRTVDVHGHPDEEKPQFLPGMYVEANIFTRMDSIMALPERSVFEHGGKHSVFIRKNPLDFEMRQITVGRQTDGWVEILNPDLHAENEVVQEGVYFLSSMIR